MLLLPFSVDHLGGFGPLGYRFLFGPDPIKTPPDSFPPPSDFHARLLYDRIHSPYAPTNILHRADENWSRTHPYSRFGASYHTSLPSHWACQHLGLNLTALFSAFLHARLRDLTNHYTRARLYASTRNKLYTPRGRPFYTRPHTSRLRSVRRTHD